MFKDQRQTDDLTELQQAGDADLAESGATVHSLKVTPSEDVAGTYGLTWTVGDMVTVVLGDEEIPARVNGAVVAVIDTGVHLSVTIGDDVATDWESGVDQSIGGLSSRVSNLERNGASAEGTPFREAVGVASTPGALAAGAVTTVSVTFPVGRFTTTPRIFLTPTNNRLTCAYASPSASGFTISAANWSPGGTSGAAAIVWRAVQMTPEAADG